MGHNQSTLNKVFSGALSGNSGNINNNVGLLSGNSGHISAISIGCQSSQPTACTPSTVTVANATCSPVSLYYKKEKMNTSELIQDTSLILCDQVGSIVIEPGRHIRCPVFEDLYVTGFHVTPDQPFDCPSGKPMFENFLAENASGEHKSCIITACGEVKFAKNGEIWVDQSDVDLKPKA